jgi:hypothetical protein
VKGLFQKNLGDIEGAQSNFTHAIALNAEFIEAKRELNLVSISNKSKDVNILSGDLKDVVGMLFKKKK